MKSIVELIQYRITPMENEKNEKNITRVFHRDDYKSLDAVIASSERGEKYEQMWEEFYFYVSGSSKALSNKMNELEQKYFPKEEENKNDKN